MKWSRQPLAYQCPANLVLMGAGPWGSVMLLQFMVRGQAEAPASTTLTVDTGQHRLVKGETYAFKDQDGIISSPASLR